MFKKSIIFIECLFVIFSPYLLHAQNKLDKKKLIEFGWDYPNVSFLKSNITSMEKMPFDGVVFSFDFDIYNAFDTTQFADSKFQFNDLSKIQWKKFTDNFLFVRGAGLSGPHWLDDNSWIKITRNLKNISKALAISKAKGIGFDPEFYFNNPKLNPWTYSPSLYNNLSYQEVGNYVRKRGKQFMQALQTEKPDVKILCFWLLGLVSDQTQSLPIDQTGMALYPFFVEGMLEGKNKSSEIIDGNESSYWYKTPESFVTSGEYLRDNGSKLIKKSLQSKFKEVSLAQSVYFDGIYGKLPGTEKHFDKQSKEQWLGENLYNAYKTTDKYVWLYGERVNWWKAGGDSVAAAIIKNVQQQINADWNNKNSILSETSIQWGKGNNQGYDYSYSKSNHILTVKLLDKNFKIFQVYNNSRLIYELKDPQKNLTINLNEIYDQKGNLILLAINSNKITSVAYVN
jgi:hypothetical protein